MSKKVLFSSSRVNILFQLYIVHTVYGCLRKNKQQISSCRRYLSYSLQ